MFNENYYQSFIRMSFAINTSWKCVLKNRMLCAYCMCADIIPAAFLQ